MNKAKIGRMIVELPVELVSSCTGNFVFMKLIKIILTPAVLPLVILAYIGLCITETLSISSKEIYTAWREWINE